MERIRRPPNRAGHLRDHWQNKRFRSSGQTSRPLVPPDSFTQTGRQKPAPQSALDRNVKGKTSFRRLSDVLHPGQNIIDGRKDLWLVVFNDIVLRSQRASITSLFLASSTTLRTNPLPELQEKAGCVTTGRKGMHTKPRNLYRFIRVKQKVYNCENKLITCTDWDLGYQQHCRSQTSRHSNIE